ncbi:hypothetical protein [Streptomyces sp. NPDC048142]|uniref:hypothetical protein n=1 Tax=Streptomyces sp. NPDC048142 TaxID=3365501 RepID=UPI0037139009
MAFYLVTDGKTNEYGEADTFVVRASGVRQAVSLAPVLNSADAEVVKLDDGRDVPHAVILSSLVDHTSEVAEPADTVETTSTETAEVLPVGAPVSTGYAVI